jgi:hypothetical protein
MYRSKIDILVSPPIYCRRAIMSPCLRATRNVWLKNEVAREHARIFSAVDVPVKTSE